MQVCLIIIGNEILSGRTQDTHLSWIAKELNDVGLRLNEVRVIPDEETAIVETVNECRGTYDYVFTTGGIGPTHDDITAAGIARAFGVKLTTHPEALAILEQHYGKENLNPARLRMTRTPEGASLIPNPVSAAPGFFIENVYVLAGVPGIMRAMFGHVKPTLKGGRKMLTRTLSANVTEGTIAEKLAELAGQHQEVEIGSYPFIRNQKLGVSLVARATDAEKLEKAVSDLRKLLLSHAPEIEEEAA